MKMFRNVIPVCILFYFARLHKISSYKCGCEAMTSVSQMDITDKEQDKSQAKDDQEDKDGHQEDRERHLKLVHWKWELCQFCDMAVGDQKNITSLVKEDHTSKRRHGILADFLANPK